MTIIEVVEKELFALKRDENRYYLYAPLQRSVAVVNGEAVRTVSRFLSKGEKGLREAELELVRVLREQGVIANQPETLPLFPENYNFTPHEVTLFLTSRCNLRCRYCYAEAGNKSKDMPWETAKAAIDLVVENAGLLGSEKFAVGFHGGGEPTMAWEMLTRSVEYAQKCSDRTGIDLETFVATNGVLTARQARYLADSFTTVNFSLDGPPDIQNRFRPMANGGKSYDAAARTLRYFKESGTHFGIRSTITKAIVERTVEIVEHLWEKFHPEYLHLEPAWLCGRCHTTGEKPPSDRDFIEQFLAASKRAGELGFSLHYSGARLDVLTSKFCAAPGDGFSVLPEGVATSCFEVTELDDPRAKVFHYGRYDEVENRFIFDREKIEALRKYSVDNIAYCRDCFCRWHCAGDCLAKVLVKSGLRGHKGSIRCELNRALTVKYLDDLVEAAEKEQNREGH